MRDQGKHQLRAFKANLRTTSQITTKLKMQQEKKYHQVFNWRLAELAIFCTLSFHLGHCLATWKRFLQLKLGLHVISTGQSLPPASMVTACQ